MAEILTLIREIAENYGDTTATVLLIGVGLIYGMYLINKNFSTAIKKYLREKLLDDDTKHKKATQHRKNITPEIRKLLSELAQETGADRALLFEYSNGTQNLVGLPFLYTSATCEVVKHGTLSIMHLYQKLNTAIIAEFIEELEDKGYYFVENIEDIKFTFPVAYNFMKPNGVTCALFYALYGVENSIGFLVITTVSNHCFEKRDSIARIAEYAQIISSMLNFDKLHEELE